MTESPYRTGLTPIPWRLRSRPVHRGYPVPWFVADVDGVPDFRIVDARKFKPALERRLCWLCGKPLGAFLAFAIGPMCAITRTVSEPPSHRECAQWAIQNCPFLTQKEHGYRTAGLPEGATEPAGIPIARQPGAGCLWITKRFRPFDAGNGMLFKLGDPVSVTWWAHGRAATRDEVMTSIDSGYPLLMVEAEKDGADAIAELTALRERTLTLVPA
jgi:hypothetical protein